MMRSKPSSSMQKTYDECYLMCSTAVYFEGQNNEAEALRSWKSALEAIYYHNAYRVSANYVPKTETERALQESLRELELQCKERVDLLEALQESRKEAQEKDGDNTSQRSRLEKGKRPANDPNPASAGWIGDGTIPAVDYVDLSKPATLPVRPPTVSRASDHSLLQQSGSTEGSPARAPPIVNSTVSTPGTAPNTATASRTSSPDKRRFMLTTLRQRDPKKTAKRKTSGNRNTRPAASKAAGLAWNAPKSAASPDGSPSLPEASLAIPRTSMSSDSEIRRESDARVSSSDEGTKRMGQHPNPSDVLPTWSWRDPQTSGPSPPPASSHPLPPLPPYTNPTSHPSLEAPRVRTNATTAGIEPKNGSSSISPPKPAPKPMPPPKYPVYRKEYLNKPSTGEKVLHNNNATNRSSSASQSENVARKPRKSFDPSTSRVAPLTDRASPSPTSADLSTKPAAKSLRTTTDSSTSRPPAPPAPRRRKVRNNSPKPKVTPSSSDQDSLDEESSGSGDDHSTRNIMRRLPKGIDVTAARQILNEIVVRGDEVHWDDVAGLETAKKALKEAVVYPFLRPDLFKGLREPARGMLLFGPPGTGKTMLARAVATESKSTFFSISASSLTSKWHGESEKLVRALFGLAKVLAPSIIFVDEIDSLLSIRSSGTEHEASRRTKTEFLIQWSDLQRAAAGREQTDGDASRVLVLAATNVPWDIDEAARRRFVRRQYIPLPEDHVREQQLRKLLSHQKQNLSDVDIKVLVGVTEGFSGSDITALAKDAAMGPLRNLGEALLDTPMDQIRPIQFEDFEASLYTIRPSVGSEGLKRYEEWAHEYGERAG